MWIEKASQTPNSDGPYITEDANGNRSIAYWNESEKKFKDKDGEDLNCVDKDVVFWFQHKDMAEKEKKFSKNQIIKTEKDICQCVVADEQYAIFAYVTKLSPNGKDISVTFDGLFAVSQVTYDFIYHELLAYDEFTGEPIWDNSEFELDEDGIWTLTKNNY